MARPVASGAAAARGGAQGGGGGEREVRGADREVAEEGAEELGRQARAFEADKSLALQELAEARAREFKARMEKEMAALTERVTQVCMHVCAGVGG